MKILLIALTLSSMPGCASLQVPLSPGLRIAESAWQGISGVDALQTAHAAEDPACYREAGSIAKVFTGTKPSPLGAVSFRLGEGIAHWAAEKWLNANDHPVLAWALEAVTLADEGSAVVHNYRVGVRIGAPNVLPVECRSSQFIHVPVRR